MLHNLYSEKGEAAKVARIPYCDDLRSFEKEELKDGLVFSKIPPDIRPLIEKVEQAINYKKAHDSYTYKPKKGRTRLFRTNSLARELRKLGIVFSFFQRDTIHFSLNVSDIAHTEVYISATKEQYTFKKQYFKFNSWLFDETIESIDTTGKDLLSVLVFLGELPEKFQPEAVFLNSMILPSLSFRR